jgi:hypothetical protein
MTVLRPGHSPPQVTMAAEVAAGSKKIVSRGPAISKKTLSSVSWPGISSTS